MTSSFRRLLAAIVLPLALVACEDGTGFDGGRQGSVSVMLTDAPGDFVQAVVTISHIELVGDGQKLTLRDDPVTVDLLTLQNQVMSLVEQVPVPGGHYTEMRLVITDGLIEVEQAGGGTRVYASSQAFADAQGLPYDGRLQMPSFGQSGLKVKIPNGGAVIDGDEYSLLIDFNVANSFGRQAGNSGMWVMHPVVHATSFTQTGAVRVQLVLGEDVELPEIDDAVVTLGMLGALLDRNGDLIPVTFTDVDDDGVFEALFRFLPPGSYEVTLDLLDGLLLTTDPAFPYTFNVTAGQTVTETFTITAADTE